MERTWRWFGKKDKITLPMLKEIGIEGIVTALHDVPNGEIWTKEKINDLKSFIESYGLRWSVVESLPVSESIKYGGPDRDHLIENYKVSLKNLSECGIHTVCYNFMPVLDWARTDLMHLNPNGTYNLYFSQAEFAYFDICILKRKDAEKDWSTVVLQEVEKLKQTMTPEKDHQLVDNIIVKTQGFVSGNIKEGDEHPLQLFRKLLSLYEGVDREKLRENMKYFLKAIMPVCNKYDLFMCVHPDDPPFQILGLPRIITCDEDISWFLHAVDNPHNGLTFCAGSLSAGERNDIVKLAWKYADRTWFVHLRSCHVFPNGDFTEASHLGGRANLIELVRIFEKANPKLPMRVDHGMTMLGDDKRGYNAGYSFLGRMFAMGQVQGIIATVDRELGLQYHQPGFLD
ncbi:MAG: mannonate dehydratase [Prevotella sp.]|jgi:mannonate dehydratase|nr:mannonate dehydratase [Prevotella sp.]MCH4182658.1 mannonate dehydratase [Prevotella sp.]MCH4211377.1 mannonate dehydratase [Prevotella sp.]MCH4240462.1 mannonate dehydratase [Prevotella sp.]